MRNVAKRSFATAISIGANLETSAWGAVMEFHLYDRDCNICDPLNRQRDREFIFELKSLVFVVHVCGHCTIAREIAMIIIEDNYDEICTATYWRNSDLKPAIRYGIYHCGYWGHECIAYRTCADCGDEYASNTFRKTGNGLSAGDLRMEMAPVVNVAHDWASGYLDRRFCNKCFKNRIDCFFELNRKELKSWYEKLIQGKRDLSQLRKLQRLFSQARMSLRQNKGHDVLQSLKTEFEQVANSQE